MIGSLQHAGGILKSNLVKLLITASVHSAMSLISSLVFSLEIIRLLVVGQHSPTIPAHSDETPANKAPKAFLSLDLALLNALLALPHLSLNCGT